MSRLCKYYISKIKIFCYLLGNEKIEIDEVSLSCQLIARLKI
jgi:hypothetical protein